MADNDKAGNSNVASVPCGRRPEPASHGHDNGPEATIAITIGDRRRWTVVAEVTGEIDLRTSQTLRGRLLDLVDEGYRGIVVDFTQVRFCDASGLGALVAAHNRLRERGGELRVAGPRPPQRRLFGITGLDRVIKVHDGVEAAVRGLGVDGTGGRAAPN
jgi:anti-sigma B factor antagonist